MSRLARKIKGSKTMGKEKEKKEDTVGPSDTGVELRIKITPKNPAAAQKKKFNKEMERFVKHYLQNNDATSQEGGKRFLDYVENAHKVAVMTLGLGSLVITVLCPTLDSLESLWNDCLSGNLNHVAERYLVTPELTEKVGLKAMTLTTTIKEDDYLACRKFFLQNSTDSTGVSGVSDEKDSNRNLNSDSKGASGGNDERDSNRNLNSGQINRSDIEASEMARLLQQLLRENISSNVKSIDGSSQGEGFERRRCSLPSNFPQEEQLGPLRHRKSEPLLSQMNQTRKLKLEGSGGHVLLYATPTSKVQPLISAEAAENFLGRLQGANLSERNSTSKTKQKMTDDVVDANVNQSDSQANARLSTSVKGIPLSVYGRLCLMLNVKRDVKSDDFRMLAEKVGLDRVEADYIEQLKNPTEEILKTWSTKSEATVGKLIDILKGEHLERMDVVKVLEDWVYQK